MALGGRREGERVSEFLEDLSHGPSHAIFLTSSPPCSEHSWDPNPHASAVEHMF